MNEAQGFEYSTPGIDISQFPESLSEATFADIVRYFKDEMPGKILTTHYQTPQGEQDVVIAAPIDMAAVLSGDVVSIITPDVIRQPSLLHLDGVRTQFVWSIYEENDLWFQDPDNEMIWYGIYDTELSPQYLVIKNDDD